MHIYHDLDSIPEGISTVVSVGKFDGVHIGHQRIIKAVCSRARELGRISVAVTFEPHPYVLFTQSPPIVLTPLSVKLELFTQLGLDAVLVLPFTHELAETAPDEFVRRVLVEKLAAKEIHEGTTFRFGKSAAAGCAYLLEAGARYGFKVQIHDPVCCGEHSVSSSLIRSLLANGKEELATMMLARPATFIAQSTRPSGHIAYPRPENVVEAVLPSP